MKNVSTVISDLAWNQGCLFAPEALALLRGGGAFETNVSSGNSEDGMCECTERTASRLREQYALATVNHLLILLRATGASLLRLDEAIMVISSLCACGNLTLRPHVFLIEVNGQAAAVLVSAYEGDKGEWRFRIRAFSYAEIVTDCFLEPYFKSDAVFVFGKMPTPQV